MAASSSSQQPPTTVDSSRWHCLYPHYLNSLKTIPEGRRVGKEHAVPNPQLKEMAVALTQGLGYQNVVLEDKAYPRDWLTRGRVRVMLKDAETAELVKPEIPNKYALLKKIAAEIKKLRPDGQIPKDPVIEFVGEFVKSGGPQVKEEGAKDKKGKKKKK